MNLIIIVLILGTVFTGIVGSGYLHPEKKYVYLDSPNNYIIFNSQTERIFIHWDNYSAEGDYQETDTDYNIFLDKSIEQVRFKKFANGTISLEPNFPEYFTYQEPTILEKMGIN
jgi:hypothetical protein